MTFVAIFISGRIKYLFDNIIFKKYAHDPNVRFFFCINKSSSNPQELDFYTQNISQSCIIQDFDLQFNLIDYKLPDNYHHTFKNYRRPETNIYNTCSMFYSHLTNYNNICSFSDKYNIKFSHILYIRSDAVYTTNFDLINSEFIMIPSEYDYRGINDRFAYLPFDMAHIYCSLYNYIYEYISNKQYKYITNKQCLFNPEILLKHHLIKNGIFSKITRFNYPHSLKR